MYDVLKMYTELSEISPLANVNRLKFLNENDRSPDAGLSVEHTFCLCCVK